MKKIFIWILTFLPLIVALVLLPYAPDQIPAHYNFQGDVTRWGSKYETLILPVITILFCGITSIITKVNSNNPNVKNNTISLEIANISLGIVFNIISYTMLITSFKGITSIGEFDLYKPISIALCVILIVLGNYMPKTKMNFFMGIRTPWTLANEAVWYKTHRVGGKGMVLLGILLTITSIFLKGSLSIILILTLLILSTIAITIYSWRISKNLTKS